MTGMDFKEKSVDTVENGTDEIEKPMRWRDLIAFWILGLCNNYGYVVMLSGAHDILITNTDEPHSSSADVTISDGRRECNAMSTGAILLADILPSLFIKVLSPFLPKHSSARMIVAITLSSMGYLLVAFAKTEVVAISGVVCTSLSSGLGESTLLAYSSHYNPNVISTWSSGTGGAGIFGAASYAILRQIGLSASDTLLLMLSIPFLMCVSFWIILTKPTIREFDKDEVRSDSQEEMIKSDGKNNGKHKPLFLSIRDNAIRMPPLFKYMGPLLLVYLFEYFINQGLYELVDFKGIWLSHNQQYRWLNVTYQIGVFLSRSSVNICPISKIWMLALLQGINVVLFLSETLYYFVPSIWIVLGFTIWEGLLGGGAYVNTYYKISRELPEDEREFALGTVSMSDAIGITIAGFLAMPVHNTICALPLPERALSF